MLVLTRKLGETVCIGPDCTVMVVGLLSDRVRLGFTAPAELEIDREEVRRSKLKMRECCDGSGCDVCDNDANDLGGEG